LRERVARTPPPTPTTNQRRPRCHRFLPALDLPASGRCLPGLRTGDQLRGGGLQAALSARPVVALLGGRGRTSLQAAQKEAELEMAQLDGTSPGFRFETSVLLPVDPARRSRSCCRLTFQCPSSSTKAGVWRARDRLVMPRDDVVLVRAGRTSPCLRIRLELLGAERGRPGPPGGAFPTASRLAGRLLAAPPSSHRRRE